MSIDVDSGRVSGRVFHVVSAELVAVRAAKRYRDKSVTDEFGRHHAKGGLWNDREGRAAYGIAKSDAADLRRALAAIGEKVTKDEADALLMQAEMGMLCPMGRTPEQERTKKQRQREKARSEGKCIICTIRLASVPQVTCYECRQKVSDARRTRAGSVTLTS